MYSEIHVEISRLYVSFFNRAADPEGMEYWVGRYDEAIAEGRDGKDFLEDIADSFAQSPEAKAIYETVANPTDAQIAAYIATAYENMFGRTPDDEGLAYWTGRWKAEMAEGKPGVRVLFEIENAARNSTNADDVAALQNKAEVAAKFTTDFIASGAQWTQADFALAASIVKGVNHTPESVQEANDRIQEIIDGRVDDPDGGQVPNPGPGAGGGNPPVDPGPTDSPGSVTIDGEAFVGNILTAKVTDANGLEGVTPTYQWFANGEAISGAESADYLIAAKDFNREIKVTVSYVDNAGFSGVAAATTSKVSIAGEHNVVVFGSSGSMGYDTIQKALADAEPNSLVVARKENYTGLVSVQASGIELRGADGAALTGGVLFGSNVDGGSVEGFSISGVADSGEQSTILVLGKNVSIVNNKIAREESVGNNTGVVIGGQAKGSVVSGNEINGFTWFGVYVNPADSNATITNNNFIGNSQALVVENGTENVSGNRFDDAGTDIRVSVRDNISVDVGTFLKENNLDSDQNVTIIASSGATITGTDANDVVRIVGRDYGAYKDAPSGGGATVNGGSGHDIIVGGRGSDTLNGGAGNDFIWGDNPNDNIRTNPNDYYGDDTIDGGSGTNVIVLGTKGHNMKLGGQDTVIHNLADSATNLIFNFNFGPTKRWDSLSSSTFGESGDGIANADQVFDIVEFIGATDGIKISIGQDNDYYQEIVGKLVPVSEYREFEFDVAGSTVYTGNTSNLELVIEFGDSKIVFANAFSKWEVGGFLKELNLGLSIDIPGTSEAAMFELLGTMIAGDTNAATSGLVALSTPAQVKALVGFLDGQGNFQGLIPE